MRALMFNADHLDDLGSARQTAATKERAPVHRLVGGHPAPALQRCISNHGDKYLRTLLIHDVSSLIRAVQMQATPSTNRKINACAACLARRHHNAVAVALAAVWGIKKRPPLRSVRAAAQKNGGPKSAVTEVTM